LGGQSDILPMENQQTKLGLRGVLGRKWRGGEGGKVDGVGGGFALPGCAWKFNKMKERQKSGGKEKGIAWLVATKCKRDSTSREKKTKKKKKRGGRW